MSARRVERALARLAQPNAVLALERGGVRYGVFLANDRRRRPLVRLNAAEVRSLEAEGAISADGAGGFTLSAAGGARVRRDAATEGEAFAAQHAPIIARVVMNGAAPAAVRGHEPNPALKRIAALRDANGASFLSPVELAAAAQLRGDWERGQAGLIRGSDWSAPPQGGAARGPGNAKEGAMTAQIDARRRVAEALDALAPPLRRVVERVCLNEEGLEALERAEGWPARSGKIALKLGLAQLAAR
ncbi:DUF6456 domain-containing protein [Terricaulis sp.]|uniref:DUF6456 domain-containing protein n=1 Tax=Terricaulis sp. TaxID=2768686 RepID=UPI003782D229